MKVIDQFEVCECCFMAVGNGDTVMPLGNFYTVTQLGL